MTHSPDSIAAPGSAWRPIETAPKDKREVLLGWTSKHSAQFGYWESGYWYVCNNGDYTDGGYGRDYQCEKGRMFPEPTHWMPLPEPPK